MDDPAFPIGSPAGSPASNIPEYSVSEISGAVKATLESAFGRVRVRGEITELKRYPSGHIYFSLKDEGGKIAGIIWKGVASRLGLAPENGIEVVATGKVSAHGERSSYQMIVDRMEYAGAGALLKRIEMLRQRLAEEGVFDAGRKRKLPRLPALIGVVTSAQGAVIQDIRTTIQRRFPRPILLWPVPVQGEGAATRIAAAIAGFDRLPQNGVPRPDVLIVARGGGSLEDLMAFNDEGVIRAVAACRIPLISAVGHETDTTLIDHVSDRRAPTPTAAAELAVPMRTELVADLAHKAARLSGALHRLSQSHMLRLQRALALLPDLPGLLGGARQRLDDRSGRLAMALPNLVAARRGALHRVERAWPDPRHIVIRARQSLGHETDRLLLCLPNLLAARRAALARVRPMPGPAGLLAARRSALAIVQTRLAGSTHRLTALRARLDGMAARLEAVSPLAVLGRGYALVFDANGHPLTSAAAIRPGSHLRLRFADGERAATASGRDAERQGSLF